MCAVQPHFAAHLQLAAPGAQPESPSVRYCWSGEMIDFLFSHQMPSRAAIGLDVFHELYDFYFQSNLS